MSWISKLFRQPTIGENNIVDGFDGAYRRETGLYRIDVADKSKLRADVSNCVDIVAVHGVGGDAYGDWTHANGNLWLRDVASQLPGSRVYTFVYRPEVTFRKGCKSLASTARTLIERIRLEQQDKRRDLIFVCNDMGGLVVQQVE